MDIEISKTAIEYIKKDFKGVIFLTYRQYTFNCMCSGGPGEFVKFDKDAYSDHTYKSYSIKDLSVRVDDLLQLNDDSISIDLNKENKLTVEGFKLFDKTKVYNL